MRRGYFYEHLYGTYMTKHQCLGHFQHWTILRDCNGHNNPIMIREDQESSWKEVGY